MYTADAAEFGEFLVVPKVDALEQVAKAAAPVAVLVSSSGEGKEVAARLALRLLRPSNAPSANTSTGGDANGH